MPEVTLRHLRQALSLYPRMISLIRLRAVTPCKRLPTLKPQKLNYSYKRKNVLLENKLFTENTVIFFIRFTFYIPTILSFIDEKKKNHCHIEKLLLIIEIIHTLFLFPFFLSSDLINMHLNHGNMLHHPK